MSSSPCGIGLPTSRTLSKVYRQGRNILELTYKFRGPQVICGHRTAITLLASQQSRPNLQFFDLLHMRYWATVEVRRSKNWTWSLTPTTSSNTRRASVTGYSQPPSEYSGLDLITTAHLGLTRRNQEYVFTDRKKRDTRKKKAVA